MSGLTLTLVSIVAFIAAIGILVTFHEFGHFWVARKLGVKVLRFSIGFGKALYSWKDKQGTEYVIAAIPLGGYVKMLDEHEGPVRKEDLPHAFNRKSPYQRFAIVFAGPFFNFIFAILAYWMSFVIGYTGIIPIVGDIEPNSIAFKAGLEEDDEILRVDGTSTPTWQAVTKQLVHRLGESGNIILEIKKHDSSKVDNISLDIDSWEVTHDKPDLIQSLGFSMQYPTIPPVVKSVMDNEPAQIAGFQEGDLIIEANGGAITDWKDFVDIVVVNINQPIAVKVKRDSNIINLRLEPRPRDDNGRAIGFAGLVVDVPKMPDELQRTTRLNPLAAVPAAFAKTWEFTVITLKVVKKMLIGDIGLQNISGPITIAKGAGVTASVGASYYIAFLALISVSLGVLNLLPVPILDGGHLMYYIFEMLTGRPVSERAQAFGFRVGVVILIFLMVVALYNDIVRLVKF